MNCFTPRAHRTAGRLPARAAVVLLTLLWSVGWRPATPAAWAEESGPDLRIEWLEDGRAVRDGASAVRGAPGQVVPIPYRLRNVGALDAFAVVLEPRTALGAAAPQRRLEPGPATGESWDRELRLVVARGMRQLCIQARLQTVRAEEPQDPNLEDNRVCRPVRAETEITTPLPPLDADSDLGVVQPADSLVHRR